MRALVVGLARSGVAATQLLREQGHDVAGHDARDGTDGTELLDEVQLLVKSPGVPRQAPVVQEALRRGIEVIGELELAWRHLRASRWVAVTGTNGKTTTVALLGHVLRTAGVPAEVAGNVGTALSSLRVGPETTIVAEASSFQLEDTVDFHPQVGVLLDVTPDHLDRHGTFEAYRAAKLRLFANMGPEDVVITREAIDTRARVVRPEPRASALRGAHNARNAGAAAEAARALGVADEDVERALQSFRGVEHRLEEVAELDGVLWVNDSKATNVDSTLTALRSFDRPVHVILGGLAKGQDLTPLRAAPMAGAYLIGEAAPALREALGHGEACGDLERAVDAAARASRPGDVVLLSPACASFDQFQDFEARGRAFKVLVQERARRRRS